jgi:hypothetical protein
VGDAFESRLLFAALVVVTHLSWLVSLARVLW